MPEFDFLLKIALFQKSMTAQKAVIHHFWDKAQPILEGSGIHLKPVPKAWTSLRHNYFSVLFIATFFILEIPIQRLVLFARLNHCLRSWVTACDNLLDNELKEIVVSDLPENARTFKSVHTLLLTDRIFFSFLLDAVEAGTISRDEMVRLLNISLTAISASGREEAEEEGGVKDKPPPEQVLYRVHSAKTGQLFTAPLEAPLALGDIHLENPVVKQVNAGLLAFGLGCQILDDISDLGTDLLDKKYNYLAALIQHGSAKQEKDLLNTLQPDPSGDSNGQLVSLYQQFPQASEKAFAEATNQLQKSLTLLSEAGLPLSALNREMFIKILVKVFHHPSRLLNLRDR
jgi:hypothetical protein